MAGRTPPEAPCQHLIAEHRCNHRGLAFDLRPVHNAVPDQAQRMRHEMRVRP